MDGTCHSFTSFSRKDLGCFAFLIILLTYKMPIFVEITSVHQKSPVYIFGIGWMISMDVQCQGRRGDLPNHVPELAAIDWDKWWKMNKKHVKLMHHPKTYKLTLKEYCHTSLDV